LTISAPSDAIGERTEVLHGKQNVIRIELQFFSNSGCRIDTCMNYTRPALAITTEPVRNAFIEAKKRGVKLRYLTEITKDNIAYCKDLISIVDEMRHLDGIKGNFMISESEYLAPLILFEKGKTASQIIYSNQKQVVEQHQYVFDTLWNKALLAQQRIKNLEGGILEEDLRQHYKTRLLESQDEIIREIKRKNNAADKLSICTGFGGMQMSYNYLFDSYKNVVDKSKKHVQEKEAGQGFGLRWITNIERDSLSLVKKFLQAGINIRHIENMPPLSFGVSDNEVAITIEKMEGGNMSRKFLISNEPLYVNHFNSLFDELWRNAVDAADRIREIEEKVEVEFVDVIADPEKTSSILLDLAKSVRNEALCLVPTVKGLIRVYKLGVIDHIIKASQNGATVKIICPITDENSHIVEKISKEAPDMRIMNTYADAPSGILIADGCKFLQAEVKKPMAEGFSEAIGFGIYSNSKFSVKSVKAFFDLLWNQHALNEQLKIHDKMQKEFINVAAHELRTPIQPIIGLSEVVLSNTKDTEQAKLLEVVNRNAKRLQRLTEDILDVTKIESQSLNLKKEQFNLNEVISNSIEDIMTKKVFPSLSIKTSNPTIKLLNSHHRDISVYADKGRISQVVSNLLDNAIKFTKAEGNITIMIKKEGEAQNNNNQWVIVSVKDTGTGIDSEVMPRLFTKFATKSQTSGTGLGLYICKGILEAHGGRIWAENNSDDKGATFSFSLPIASK
jgi:two-component system, OmpR family, sensor histidine kinase VicK